MSTELIPGLLRSHFDEACINRLRNNLDVLKNVVENQLIISNKDGSFKLDDSYTFAKLFYTPQVLLNRQDIKHTLKDMKLIVLAITDKATTLNKNIELAELAGRVTTSSHFYFAKVNLLVETYKTLGEQGILLSQQLSKILERHQPKLKQQIRAYHQAQLEKKVIPTIPDNVTPSNEKKSPRRESLADGWE